MSARPHAPTVVFDWSQAKVLGEQGVAVPWDVVAAMLNSMKVQAPEFEPTSPQLKTLHRLRGKQRCNRKQLKSLIGRRVYDTGPGSVQELIDEGMLLFRGGFYTLTDMGESIAREWADDDSPGKD